MSSARSGEFFFQQTSPLLSLLRTLLHSFISTRSSVFDERHGWKRIILTLSLSLFLSLDIPDKDPYPIDALPTCNHALSVCLRGKPCSQIYEDFKSNCKAREGKCRMESRWVKTLHHYHSLFYFRRSRGEPSRKRGSPLLPVRRRAVSPRVNIYVCSPLMAKMFPPSGKPMLSLPYS